MAEFDDIVKQNIFRRVDSTKPHVWEMPRHYEGGMKSSRIPCRWCSGRSFTWKHVIGLARAMRWLRKKRKERD